MPLARIYRSHRDQSLQSVSTRTKGGKVRAPRRFKKPAEHTPAEEAAITAAKASGDQPPVFETTDYREQKMAALRDGGLHAEADELERQAETALGHEMKPQAANAQLSQESDAAIRRGAGAPFGAVGARSAES
jgi:hypothetical protein